MLEVKEDMKSEGNVRKVWHKLSTIKLCFGENIASIVREERRLCNKQHHFTLISCLASEMDWK